MVTLMKPNRPQPSACMMKAYIDAASFKILLNYIVTSLRFYSAVIEVARSVVPGVSCMYTLVACLPWQIDDKLLCLRAIRQIVSSGTYHATAMFCNWLYVC